MAYLSGSFQQRMVPCSDHDREQGPQSHPGYPLSLFQSSMLKDRGLDVAKAYANQSSFYHAALDALGSHLEPACGKAFKAIDNPQHLQYLVHTTLRQNAATYIRALGGTPNSIVQGIPLRWL